MVSVPNLTSMSRAYERAKFFVTRRDDMYRRIRCFSTPRALHRRLRRHGFTPVEVAYYCHGGILAYVLRQLLTGAAGSA